MERICESCGSLVSGEGKFCPTCGAPLGSAVNLSKGANTMPSQPQPQQQMNYTANPNMNMGYGAPQYGQPINPNIVPTQQMTTGQWIGTILLCSCFGLISIILTAVWAFGSSTPEPKRGFCKGFFFAQLILLGVAIILVVIFGAIIAANIDVLEDFFDGFERSYRHYF